MEDILNDLYLTYNTLLNDLNIGHTLDNKKIEYLWDLIYKLYFTKYENYANKDVLKLLEYYEYNSKTASSNKGFVRDYLKGKSFDFSEWNPVKTYINDSFKQDFVKYSGDLYACIHTNTNVVPGTSECWMLVVASRHGKSAYEIWLEKGNVGSEEDFLEAYRGYPGEKGDSGNKINIGSGAPTISGSNEDLYINSDNGDIYKFDSAWKSIGSIGTKVSLVEASSQLTDFEKSAVRSNLGIDTDTFALKSDLKIFDWEEI